jgi:HAE1 family hydrophobic/amphiphilic exporter-1
VLMSTLTTAAVFMPILLLKGEVGTLFGPVACPPKTGPGSELV